MTPPKPVTAWEKFKKHLKDDRGQDVMHVASEIAPPKAKEMKEVPNIPIPGGSYRAEVVSAIFKPSAMLKDILHVKFCIVDGRYAGRYVMAYFSATAETLDFQIGSFIGIPRGTNSLPRSEAEVLAKATIGNVYILDIIVVKYPGFNVSFGNRVTSYLRVLTPPTPPSQDNDAVSQ